MARRSVPAAPAPVHDEPPPTPPVRPTIDDCCHGGCEMCVFDLYEEEIDRYETELQAWEARRIERNKLEATRSTKRAAAKRPGK